jgi:ribonuclease HI
VQVDGILFVDGASLGNPGEGGCGIILKDGEGRLLYFGGEYLGRVTNNQAEYMALIRGLEEAHRRGCNAILVLTDSELLVRQINGEYKVRDQKLQVLYEKVKTLLRNFPQWEIKHVEREKNREADKLAKKAAQRKL